MNIVDHGASICRNAVSRSLIDDLKSLLRALPADRAGILLHGIVGLTQYLSAVGAVGSLPIGLEWLGVCGSADVPDVDMIDDRQPKRGSRPWRCRIRRIRARLSANCALEPLRLTVTSVAAALGVSRKALSELLNGHANLSPDMASRLENG